MADHSEVVIDAMVVALAAISTGSGDSFTPAVAERHDRYQSVKGDLPNIQVARQLYRQSREPSGAGNWVSDLFVDVMLLIDATKDGVTPTDKQISVAESDCKNAIIGMDWETLAANLAGFESTPLSEESPEEPDNGIIITVNVQYKLAFADLTLSIDPS